MLVMLYCLCSDRLDQQGPRHGLGEIDDEVRCPSCQVAPQTAALPVIRTHYQWPTELPGAKVERIRPARQSVIRHLRLA